MAPKDSWFLVLVALQSPPILNHAQPLHPTEYLTGRQRLIWILIIHTLSILPPFLFYWLLVGNSAVMLQGHSSSPKERSTYEGTVVPLPTTRTNFLAFWVIHGGKSSSPSFHVSAILPDILTASSQKTLNQNCPLSSLDSCPIEDVTHNKYLLLLSVAQL